MRLIIQVYDEGAGGDPNRGASVVVQCNVPTLQPAWDRSWAGDDYNWTVFNGGCLKYFEGLNRRGTNPSNGFNLRIGVNGRANGRFYFGLSLFAMWDDNALLNDSGSALLEKWFAGPNMLHGWKKWKLVDASIFSGPLGSGFLHEDIGIR